MRGYLAGWGSGGVDCDGATALPEDIAKGKTAGIAGHDGLVTGTMAELGARTYTPGTKDIEIAAGPRITGKQVIKGDANLLGGNIVKGRSLFGVAGTRNYIDKIGRTYNYDGYNLPSGWNDQVITINTPETANYPYILAWWGCGGAGYFALSGAGSTTDRIYLQFDNLYYKLYMIRPTLTSLQLVFTKVSGSGYGICNQANVRICAGSNVSFS